MFYQIAIVSRSGFTKAAKDFAIVHRIPLIELCDLPAYDGFRMLVSSKGEAITKEEIRDYSNEQGNKIAISVLDSGQVIILNSNRDSIGFNDYYSLSWGIENKSKWILKSGEIQYAFSLPKEMKEMWIEKIVDDDELRKKARKMKGEQFSKMVVYYMQNGMPQIKCIGIDQEGLKKTCKEYNKWGTHKTKK